METDVVESTAAEHGCLTVGLTVVLDSKTFTGVMVVMVMVVM